MEKFIGLKLSEKKFNALLFLFLIGFYFLLINTYPQVQYIADVEFWANWSKHIFLYGIENVYDANCNYPPLYLYVLWGFGKIVGNVDLIDSKIYLLKNITLITDIIGLFMVLTLIKSHKWKIICTAIFCLNVSYFYNTLIWGQIDAIPSLFCFLAVYFGIRKKTLFSFFFILIAINFKLQAIIFLPILFFLVDKSYLKNAAKITLHFFILVGIQALILLPFLNSTGLSQLKNMVENSVGFYPFISMNAFNLWYILPIEWVNYTSDLKMAGPLSYHTWGLLLFFIFSAFALFPFIKNFILEISSPNKKNKITPEQVYLISGLICILFFFFNTQMHERYSHYALLFFMAYTVLSKKFIPIILCSIGIFLNMDGVLHFFKPEKVILFFYHPIVPALAFLILILLSMFYIYNYQKKIKQKR